MAIVTDLNAEPYFDDFDETKNFHRILFKPSTAVQARELTQLQTILQNQIERFGDNILREGTIIKGGNFVEESPLPYVKLLDAAANTSGAYVSTDANAYIGMKVVGATTGIEAIVIDAIPGLETQNPDLSTLYVRYTKNAQNANNENVGVFSTTEQLQVQQLVSGVWQNYHLVTIAGSLPSVGSAAIGNGYGVRCGDGIIYQKGHFVRFVDDLTIVSKYDTQPNNVVVGFLTEEELITSNQDESLLDNANGFNNYQAPGADRLKLTPVLTVKTTALAKADENFFSLQEYVNGKVVRRNLSTQYSSLEAMIEKRTAEESGDYTVSDFPIRIEQSTSNTSNLAVVVGAGVAYVNGKRTELTNDIYIETPETLGSPSTQYNQDVITNYGHYVVANTTATPIGLFNNFSAVSLRNGAGANTGTAYVRVATKETASATSNVRLYLFGVEMASGQSFEDVRKVVSTANTEATLVLESGSAVIKDYSFKTAIFPIGRNNIKSLSANTDYIYRKYENITTSGNSTISTITVTLGSDTFPYSVGALNTDQTAEFLITSASSNQIINPTSITVSSPTQLVITTAVPTGTSANVLFNAKKVITNSNITKKTLETVYVKVDCSNNVSTTTGNYVLGLPDVYELVGVWKGTTYDESNADVTSYFKLLNGQNDNYYGHAKIVPKRNITLTAADKLLIKVRTFRRDATNINAFFTVDSYPVDDTSVTIGSSNIRTENIPSYTMENGKEIYLRDVIDMRPYIEPTTQYATTIAGATQINPPSTVSFNGSSIAFATPNQSIETTYDYYVGRKDTLIINETGDFQIVNGVPSENPSFPFTPQKSMVLAHITIPPFPSLPAAIANRAGKPSYGVSVNKTDNKRYTMRDVGGIDRRLKNLEYYTSLNLLEKSATDLVITDANGLDRFKNGILVDNFENLSIADVKNTEFAASIDPSYKEINPRFRSYPIDLKVTSTSNTTDYGKALTLTKTDISVIDQSYATDIRSCTTSFYKYTGAMQLVPAYDSAPDYTQAPDVNINIDLATPFAEFTEALQEFVPLRSVNSTVVSSNTRRSGGFLGLFRNRITTDTIKTVTSELSVTEGLTQTVDIGDFVSNVDFLPYMRTKEVKVYITGLRPSTRFYFFFDGKDVNAHVATGVFVDGEVKRSSEYGAANVVLSDSTGVLSAVFRIPANTFFVGDRTLEVMDVPLYTSKDSSSSYASKVYSGFNFQATKTGLATSTRTAEIDIVRTTTFTQRQRRGGGSDPIAQTFIVDTDLSTDDSVMITKLDLFFAKKSTVGNGVTVQLRETENGYPSGTIVPLSTVHLNASEITANAENASAATTVTFSAPIAIKTGTEYAIVVAPDANDPDYFLWVAKTGGTDVDTGTSITQDTNAGVLFTSTNNKAWTPYQNENMKFVMYRANFTSSTGYVTFTNNDNEFLRVSNVVSGSVGTYYINDEYVFNANSSTAVSGTISIVAGNTTVTGTGTQFGTSEISIGEHVVVKNGTDYQVLKVASIANTTQMTVSDIPTASASVTTYWKSPVGKVTYFNIGEPPMLILENSTAKTGLVFAANTYIMGQQSKTISYLDEVRDLPVSYLQSDIARSSFNTTRVDLVANKLYNISGPTYAADLEFGDNNYFTNNATYIRSKSNAPTTTSFELQVNLANISTGSKDVSPLVDHEISGVTAYEFFINNSANNELTSTGEASSKYISKRVELADGLDAADVRTYLTAYKPLGTDLKVYVKFQSSTDPRNFNEIEWSELIAKTETNATSSSANRFDFREIVYDLGTTAKTAGQGAWLNGGVIRYIAPNGAIYNSYKYFAVKIVMLSSRHNAIPRILDMRTIALS